MHDVRRHIASCLKFMALTACFHIAAPAVAQELNAKVTINRSQISNTTDAVFEALQNSLTAFINERQWTGMTYEEEERINCTFSITLKTYSETDNSFTGSIQVQSTRPVYDSNYSTTVFNFQDENFNFTFQQFDQLEFRPEQVDNNLTAVIAYYAYLIIGMDMDTMAPLGGSDILQMASGRSQQFAKLGLCRMESFRKRPQPLCHHQQSYLDGADGTAPATGIRIPPSGTGPHDGKYRYGTHGHHGIHRNTQTSPRPKKHEHAARHIHRHQTR